MRMSKLEVSNFRSYFGGGEGRAVSFEVGASQNILLGANNCGKSNLLSALRLALDGRGESKFVAERDAPAQAPSAEPRILVEFVREGPPGMGEADLFTSVAAYEASAGLPPRAADEGKFTFCVHYDRGRRVEGFVLDGAKTGDRNLRDEALRVFHDSFRFIYLKSGESLSNFLTGAFNQLIRGVLQEKLGPEYEHALADRSRYIEKLKVSLLNPLGEFAREELEQVMGEVSAVEILPAVPTLEESLEGAEFLITDGAKTSMLAKGTGVRGAMLFALLNYLSRHSTESLILAVEEPESFLHPGAQEELREDFSRIASRPNVSLLVTTHSPFMIDRSPHARVSSVLKDANGQSHIPETVSGEAALKGPARYLFRDVGFASALESAAPVGSGVAGVVFVEGYSDKLYLETALAKLGEESLLAGIELRASNGAHAAALDALLLRQLVGAEFPIAVLFDADAEGASARKLLSGRFQWRKRFVPSFRQWRDTNPQNVPVEAEDLFGGELLADFVREHGDDFLAEKSRYQDGSFHYGLTQPGKEIFLMELSERLFPEHCERWLTVAKDLRALLGLN